MRQTLAMRPRIRLALRGTPPESWTLDERLEVAALIGDYFEANPEEPGRRISCLS